MSAIEGGHVENIDQANRLIREIVEARNASRSQCTDACTCEIDDDICEEIREEQVSADVIPAGIFTNEMNPKDRVGSDKLPLHLWPTTASAMGCVALLNGALKYGRSNWRAIGVRSSIYYDACSRHLAAWFEGEDADEEGVPHLASALACLAIVVDAQAAGKLIDDRQYPGGHRRLIDSLTTQVARLKSLHSDRSPRDWTIHDRP